MRFLVFFDLPTKTKQDKKNYARFRNFLLSDGYVMVQYSVYSRLIFGHESIEKHEARIAENAPLSGSIRCLQITDRQFISMKILTGAWSDNEIANGNQMVLVF